jgi:hypothetical protein
MKELIMFCANTVLNQFTQSNNGTGRLKAMIGAKDFAQGEKCVSFKFAKSGGVNYAKVTLNSSDTYTLELGLISSKADPDLKAIGIKVMLSSYKIVSETPLMYHDQLKAEFEQETGLYLTL